MSKRICTACKQSLELIYFLKESSPIDVIYFKLCSDCRTKGREKNHARWDKKSQQSKEYYIKYKDEVQAANKKWRAHNKEKLQAYEKSDFRKEKNKSWVKLKRLKDPSTFLFYSAKRRSKLSNLEFTITKEHIRNIYPKDNKCPILGIDLFVSNKKTTDNSPSLDRIDSKKGYVPENILVISHRANRIKNNSTIDELYKIYSFLNGLVK